ncbi:MAG TPA: RNA polymerase sigma-54 factor [Acidobacteriaceae bacterium]|nr:RNA polymerase sigma-54 factor [Acidobacteriaceae bacterium]
MALLQPRLNLKVSQKQVLTPGLVQMVSLLALNKQELREMIDAELLENPVLEELEEAVPLAEEIRTPEEAAPATEEKAEEKDPFDEIDFGSYFQDYLDPGYRTPQSTEINEKPSFENFLSKPTTLTDHLMWQLGSLHLTDGVREAAELIIGNLDEDGYLTASDEELLAVLAQQIPPQQGTVAQVAVIANPNGHRPFIDPQAENGAAAPNGAVAASNGVLHHGSNAVENEVGTETNGHKPATEYPERLRRDLAEALHIVRRFDPVGIAARDLRECLLTQLDVRTQQAGELAEGIRLAAAAATDEDEEIEGDSRIISAVAGSEVDRVASERIQSEACAVMALARRIIDEFLPNLLKRDIRELSRFTGSPQPKVQLAIESIRGLDPKPGQRYNREQVRLIEPDVAFQKRDDDYVILINDEEMPTLRLNQGYRRMLSQEGTEREVRDYVKERYRSAIQLMRNIEQRKNTIVRTCEVIVRRQREFLEQGVDSLKPMMIKDVAEEIGVHASTVSRAVANKYVHTPQGVFELRFFFSEGVNGPEGSDTPLLLLKRKVKKMIEDEDSSKPLTDDAIANLLQSQGIAVNRRTVAKYREDMGIPSTHQRRVRI